MRTRCADCQKQMKPVVALDIDGTLGNYHDHFIRFAEGYLDTALPDHFNYDGSEAFWKYLGMELPQYREVKLAYRQGGLKRTMPSYQGASGLSNSLSIAGAEIWICTTRPHLRLDNVDPDTREWLRRNDVVYDYMVYGDDKYQQLSGLVAKERIVGVLEDLPEQYMEAKELGLSPILRSNFHNSAFRGGRGKSLGWKSGVWDLSEATHMLTRRVLNWHRQHTDS